MTEDKKQSTDSHPSPMTPEDVVNHLGAIIAENVHKSAKGPRPNRTELLNHLQAIFNEAREDRRSYRALRAAFSTAVGVATMLQNNIFNNIQSTSDGVTSLAMITLFMGTGLHANRIAHKRIAELTRTGRKADERIREVSQSTNNIFEAKEFVTYLEIFEIATAELEKELAEVKKLPKKFNLFSKENHEDSAKTRSEETRLMRNSLTLAFLISFCSIVYQIASPREGQHVFLENISKEQHVVIDKIPNPATPKPRPSATPKARQKKSSCPVVQVNKDGKVILEISCDKPEQAR